MCQKLQSKIILERFSYPNCILSQSAINLINVLHNSSKLLSLKNTTVNLFYMYSIHSFIKRAIALSKTNRLMSGTSASSCAPYGGWRWFPRPTPATQGHPTLQVLRILFVMSFHFIWLLSVVSQVASITFLQKSEKFLKSLIKNPKVQFSKNSCQKVYLKEKFCFIFSSKKKIPLSR